MSVGITSALADDYFKDRIEDALWRDFDSKLRGKALQTAKDILSRSLGSDIVDETVDDTNYYYPDRAVYHQALFILLNSDVTANGTETGPKFTGQGIDGDVVNTESGYSLSKESRRYMNWQGTGGSVRISRG